MKCPLTFESFPVPPEGWEHSNLECLQEKCAWWVEASESCAMEAIPRIIGFLGCELKSIKDKMPKDLAPKG